MDSIMKRSLTKECTKQSGKVVLLQGWVKKIRHLGNVSFLLLRDRTGVIQCVLENELAGYKVDVESIVHVIGEIVETSKTELGVEVLAHEVKVINGAEPLPFEINKKKLQVGLDQLLNERVLSLRHERTAAIFKVKSTLVQSFSEVLIENDFTRIFTPKIVSQGAEGGANVFKLPYFQREAYLAQSPQFYKQMMVAGGLERVFEIAPVYRAEHHNSSRHLNEYISLDVELGFIHDFYEVMQLETDVLRYMFQQVAKKCEKELQLLQIEVPVITEIPKITLLEAQEILKSKYRKESPVEDLDTEGEKLLGKYVKEIYNSEFVFITHYPKEARPMYTMPNKENPSITDSFDLLYKGLEITSGAQRIHNHEMLLASFKEKGLHPEKFQSYLNTFRYGCPPHGGFGIGLERVVYKLLELTNVREASAFPRDCTRLIP
ncbi:MULTISPECIES: aspartate--tRNA(Asn) ligase [Bacillus]|uniref:Aspartate--tRNA ligase n=4 Tax=Bacillus cereus group TaxID=86661 RepID=A0A9W5K8T8_BACC8|nr:MULTISPECIES: aspartate--tRNA(Asn) ligase [Bacillus]AMR02573.1 aspartate--tRNA(Asn) ligase [Bacillus thuringiensis]ANP81210.1 aspartate--tRNA(Asn) ligase [Bacillus sp. B25(2016b)]AYF79804.1 aspartate--tRNA(Asn) ligase [Bacillus thuringiensis]EEM84020.1 Aspartyl/asparaginyl-tRNA synthetase [Bacillus thuringiensis serovar huazhongensis BGSC 4BD1]EJR23481.1 aspartate-tRNA ligase [Bacillus cereus VD014]